MESISEADYEFIRFVSEDSSFYAEEIDGEVTTQYHSDNELFVRALFQIERFVDYISLAENLNFKIRHRSGEIPRLLGKLPSDIFRVLNRWLRYYSNQYSYSPKVELFFVSCFAVGLGAGELVSALHKSRDGKFQFEKINTLIDLIREGLDSHEFKQAQKQSDKRVKDRIDSAADYVDHLFREGGGNSRLIVLRLDFYYKRQYRKEVSVKTVKADIKRFLDNRRNNRSLFQHLKGYIWKLEYGEHKGFHVHWIFFMDGREVQNDYVWASKLGQYWQEVITDKKGYYNNGNARKEQYWHFGVGRIERRDTDKLNVLKSYVIPYLAKADQYLRAKQLGNERVFGRGEIDDTQDKDSPNISEHLQEVTHGLQF